MRGRNTLDLVFTDDDQLVSSVVADETIGDSDHDTVKFVIVLESTDNQTHVLADDTRFVWSKANFDLIDSYLSSIDWQLVLQNNPETLQFWSAVESTIYDSVEIAVPKQTTPKRGISAAFLRLRKQLLPLTGTSSIVVQHRRGPTISRVSRSYTAPSYYTQNLFHSCD